MENTKKNKLFIAVTVLAVALMAALGAMFGVYAATQQNVKSAFTVSYDVADNIALKVTSSYQLAGDEKVTLPEIRFNAPDATDTKTVEIPEIVLTGDKPYVDLSYRFDPLNDQQFTVDIFWEKLLENSENIKITATYSFMQSTNGIQFWTQYNPDTKTGTTNGGTPFGTGANFPVDLSQGWNYIQCDYRFEIDDPNKDAFITSSEDGGLHYSFQQW